MTLDWSFSFLRPLLGGECRVDLICSFRNGKSNLIVDNTHSPEILSQMEPLMILLNYIAQFPNRDFTKINLTTSQHQLAVHFLDKRYLNEGFLGVMSVSEFDTNVIFDGWGVEEMMAEYIFDYYRDFRRNHDGSSFLLNEFHGWLCTEIADFFIDWQDARKDFIPAPIPILSLKNNLEMGKKYEHWWDLQVINEFGQPLTDPIAFIDNSPFILAEENEKISQALESMSLSALKILIDQQDVWNIRYIKGKIENNMGFQYTFFKKFSVHNIKFLIVMNSSIYSEEEEECLQIFRGNEQPMLERLAERLENHSLMFSEIGLLKSGQKDLIHAVILKCVQDFC